MRRAVRLVAERDAAFVGIGEVLVRDDPRCASGLLEGDVFAHRTLRNRGEVVAVVAELHGVKRAALHRD